MKKLLLLVLVALPLLASAVLGWQAIRNTGVSVDGGLGSMSIDARTYDLFDLGAVDVNGDGNLDIYTVNHSARQSLLLGDGTGQFSESFSRLKLDQDHNVAAVEDVVSTPAMDAPGLYIYRANRWLTIAVVDVEASAEVTGTLAVDWPLELRDGAPAGGNAVELDVSAQGASQLTFSLRNGDSISVTGENDIVEVPHRFRIDPGWPLDKVYLGADNLNPEAHDFELMWRDRHSMAWSDVDDDGHLDVFIARGAIKGSIGEYGAGIADELMFRRGAVFVDAIGDTGISKEQCPGRKSTWVDVNKDSRLDLYIACGRAAESGFPNQLWIRQDDGTYADSAPEFGLDFLHETVFVWLDADTDGDQDLFSIDDGTASLSVNHGRRFEHLTVASGLPRMYRLTAADFDNDGDLDVFGVHRSRSKLFQNDRGSFSVVEPDSVGLPRQTRTAVWADLDNDGRLDLFTVPDGAYLQQPDGRFRHEGIVEFTAPVEHIPGARAELADFDNDGRQDFVVAVQHSASLFERIANRFRQARPELRDRWRIVSSRNQLGSANNWLQVRLTGPAGNREAIGARVYIATGETTQLRQVGNADGAHYGQGHYRLYFGLGSNDKADYMQIVWPDGRIQELHGIGANQLFHQAYDRPQQRGSDDEPGQDEEPGQDGEAGQ